MNRIDGRVAMRRDGWLVAALLLTVAMATPVSLAGQSLNVLLTNDDGYDAPGIAAVREALLEAGHRVTVVAPLENQSGVGSAITTSGTMGRDAASSHPGATQDRSRAVAPPSASTDTRVIPHNHPNSLSGMPKASHRVSRGADPTGGLRGREG